MLLLTPPSAQTLRIVTTIMPKKGGKKKSKGGAKPAAAAAAAAPTTVDKVSDGAKDVVYVRFGPWSRAGSGVQMADFLAGNRATRLRRLPRPP